MKVNFNIFHLVYKLGFVCCICSFLINCESNINEVRKINLTELNPVGEAENFNLKYNFIQKINLRFNLKYTDSGKIKAILVSPQMLDYSNLEFPFSEFPKGIKVTIYDEKGNKSFVTSKYAISYSKSNLIDLRGNVKITTSDGKILETEQLYYDQANECFFTQKIYKFTDKSTVINGIGIDFSKDFKVLDTQTITGIYGI